MAQEKCVCSFFGLCSIKAQTAVTIKEVVNYVGKEVTLCDSVYSKSDGKY